ncbi:nuclear nucleic acid-binding protein C1D [Aplysia californica]|uniref:Nuclear nucleic acid-binding protein C1D n=1 Tax=Aplysia californica TaxID=6500 RepID=A0ABM0JIH5_APLCA|nr:nuclear nucleic acid-binding protein C1D [Aplysia californica]
MTGSDDGIPRELKEKLAKFDTHLSELEGSLSHMFSLTRAEIVEKVDAIDVAKTDLVAAYAINSLFWMYLNVCGINPKEHAVKQELTRIQSYMARVKEVEEKKKEKAKAPKLDKKASRRFIMSALWLSAQKNEETGASTSASQEEGQETQAEQQNVKSQGKKRRRDER